MDVPILLDFLLFGLSLRAKIPARSFPPLPVPSIISPSLAYLHRSFFAGQSAGALLQRPYRKQQNYGLTLFLSPDFLPKSFHPPFLGRIRPSARSGEEIWACFLMWREYIYDSDFWGTKFTVEGLPRDLL
jgi:hypothetical protein